MSKPTPRQAAWLEAASKSSDRLAKGLFLLIAQPNEQERPHNCREHTIGFRHGGRRGFRCGICHTIVKWIDPEMIT